MSRLIWVFAGHTGHFVCFVMLRINFVTVSLPGLLQFLFLFYDLPAIQITLASNQVFINCRQGIFWGTWFWISEPQKILVGLITCTSSLSGTVYRYIWAAPSEFVTYRLCEQRRFRRACASAQSRQNLRCSLIQAVSEEEPSDRKPNPWPLWMAGHAQLKFVMTECSKTQIRLTGLI